MKSPQSTFSARNPARRLAHGNSDAPCQGRTAGFGFLRLEAACKSAVRTARALPLPVAAVLLTIALGAMDSRESSAATLRAGVQMLADSGTGEPSDSETQAPPGEDEPPAEGEQRPAAPQDGERGPGEDFGCPVREQGPYPLLI